MTDETTDLQNEIDSIVTEARDTFDLGDFLREVPKRMKTIKLYTDEEAGEELGGHEVRREVSAGGVVIPRLHTWGLKGEYVELTAANQDENISDAEKRKNNKRLKEIKAAVAAVLERIEKSSIELELRSVPKVIKKDAARAARKALDITQKGIPEALEEEFSDEYDAQLLSRVIMKVTRGDGAVAEKFSIEEARSLRDLLPDSEYERLSGTLIDLLFKSQISAQAIEDSDF